jgi:tetratricopeptide (TPR) repeat protein
VLAVLLTTILTAVAPAAARGIHYGAVVDEAVLACDRLHWAGATERSIPCYQDVLASTANASDKAEAAWAMNELQAANAYFRDAMNQEPQDAATLTRWGDLFADTHQEAEAMNIYREALQLDPDYGFALLGAATVLVGGFDEAASAYLEQLLSGSGVHEGAQVGAWLLVARMALENSSTEAAREALDKSTDLVARNDWPLLDIYAMRAAADLLDGKVESEWTQESLDANPRYGGIYSTPAHIYVITRRYREAIGLYQKAVDIEPGLAAAHEALGVNLLRDNQMTRARKHLETAHDQDPFSPVAVNTLRLLDSFSRFELISDPASPEYGDELPVILRLHNEEAASIAPYAIKLARDSIEEFTRRYGFELREPVVIEMYPDHEDFAVRTAGMPGIGILGATFGYVIAMDSPSARSTDHFQWGTTLWHEMAHVFTLEATKHLVPRWFSEGVSVYEEWRSGPNPGVRIPLNVYTAMRDDKFLPIGQLDEGFIRPTYPDQVIVSYMQAGIVCQFIDEVIGTDKLAGMLSAYADGMDTVEAIETVLGYDADRFDEEFAEFVQAQHGAFLEQLDDWHALQAEAAQQLADGEWEALVDSATSLLDMHRGYVASDSPYLMLAKAHYELGSRARAIETMAAFRERGGYDPAALKQNAEWLLEAGRQEEAIEVLMSINLVQPLDTELHGKLGDLLLDSGDAAAALQEYQIALARDPHDKATAHYRVASAYRETGEFDLARSSLLQALDIAPGYRPAQKLLLELARSESDRNSNH